MAGRKKTAPDRTDDPLRPKRELFCRYYTQNKELFGEATLSYAEAFGYDLDTLSREGVYETILNEDGEEEQKLVEASPYDKAYHVCAVEASKLLKNPDIQDRCRVLLNELLKDEVVDSERAKVIMQDRDLASKLRGIISYDKLRGRIIDKTQQVNRLPFGETDLSTVIATLPQERQDYFYAIITDTHRRSRASAKRWQRLKAAALGSVDDIRRRYAGKPIKLLQFIDPTMRFPKKIRYIFALLWLAAGRAGPAG